MPRSPSQNRERFNALQRSDPRLALEILDNYYYPAWVRQRGKEAADASLARIRPPLAAAAARQLAAGRPTKPAR